MSISPTSLAPAGAVVTATAGFRGQRAAELAQALGVSADELAQARKGARAWRPSRSRRASRATTC